MSKKVLLLYGGISPEHNISCASARFIYDALVQGNFNVLIIYVNRRGEWHLQDEIHEVAQNHKENLCFLNNRNPGTLITTQNKEYEFDIVFPIIHGRTGEDGCLQGMLDFLDIPYVGAGVLTSSICMDKYYAKTFMEHSKLPVVPYLRIDCSDWKNWPNQIKGEILEEISFPLFVKPCNTGSSIGASKVNKASELEGSIVHAFQYDTHILIEKYIDARELEIAIMGNHPNYKVTTIGEIIVNSEFYSYEIKYEKNVSALKIPAHLTQQQSSLIRDMATAVFRLVHGDGLARIDFFLDKKNNEIYINEINTLPGFTPISMFPKLWESSGVKPHILISNLIRLGFERQKKETFKRTYED